MTRSADFVQLTPRLKKMGPDAAKIDTKHPERRKRITQVKAAHNKRGGKKR